MSRYLCTLMLMGLIRFNCDIAQGLEYADGDVVANNVDVELDAKYWNDVGRRTIEKHVDQGSIHTQSDSNNIILVVGSGMSHTTVRAAGMFNGQKDKNDFSLSFEKFPVVGFAKSHCVDTQVGDNACTSTAYLGGFKGNYDTIGMSDPSSDSKHMDSIAQWAIDAGKDVGIVTTSRLTQASVAGMYGHAPISKWENDVDVLNSGKYPILHPDLAYQLIHDNPGNKFKVILGGGKENFLPQETEGGKRKDARNLIDDWKNAKIKQGLNHKFISNRKELLEIKNETQYLLGLFNTEDLAYHLLADEIQPNLEEMVEVAIKILSKNPKGFFLFVFGGRINDAHRLNKAKIALDETVELSKAVDKITAITNTSNTLVVVTADHGSTMTISGYSSRWNDILGLIDDMDDVMVINISYPTLSYATGPGFRPGDRRYNTLTDYIGIGEPNFAYPSNVMLDAETHGGEDVPVFVKGPWQEIFSGCYGIDILPHMMGYVGCIGPGAHSCKSSAWNINPSFLLCLISLIITIF